MTLYINAMKQDFASLWEAAQRRRMSTPLRLFAEGHAPLAFIAGQALYMIAPLAALLGWAAPQDWAERLSQPNIAAPIRDPRR